MAGVSSEVARAFHQPNFATMNLLTINLARLGFAALLACLILPNTLQAQSEDAACRPLCSLADVPPSDPYAVLGLSLSGDCLEIDVEYSGGCLVHGWCLFWNGALTGSTPPQALLYLWHDDKNDPCDAIVQETLRYDVSGLQDPNYNLIILQVVTPNGLIYTIPYSY